MAARQLVAPANSIVETAQDKFTTTEEMAASISALDGTSAAPGTGRYQLQLDE